MWQSREGAGQEEKSRKRKQKGKLNTVSEDLAHRLVARCWLYREAGHKALVANDRKEGGQANRKASSGRDSSETRGHPDVLFVVRGIR